MSRRLSRTALVLVLALGLLGVVNPAPAFACSCARSSLRANLDRSDVVFLGTVREVQTLERPTPGRTEITFAVTRVFKGTAYAEQVVTSPLSGQCGLEAQPGSQLLVLGVLQIQEGGTSALRTSLCSGNLATSSPPSAVGQGYAPLSGSSEQVDRALRLDQSLTKTLTAVGIGALAVLVLGGLGVALLWRRKPNA